jgi:hypothetical protein
MSNYLPEGYLTYYEYKAFEALCRIARWSTRTPSSTVCR